MGPARFTDRALAVQGFSCGTDPALRRVEPWLRLTPSLSALWIGTGTALASPRTLLAFSLVSAIGAAQRKHPFDPLYDGGRRGPVKGEPLPDNPPPRRFAMGLAAAWAAAAAALLATGHRRAGLVAGSLLTAAGVTVAATHVCLGSWV